MAIWGIVYSFIFRNNYEIWYKYKIYIIQNRKSFNIALENQRVR